MAAVSHLQQVKIPIEFRFDMINFDTVGGRSRVKYIVHSRVCAGKMQMKIETNRMLRKYILWSIAKAG